MICLQYHRQKYCKKKDLDKNKTEALKGLQCMSHAVSGIQEVWNALETSKGTV